MMNVQPDSSLAHIVAYAILNAQALGANEVWLRSGLSPVCTIGSEPRSVYGRDVSRREVESICKMMRVVARRAGQTDETVTQFDAPITDYITVRCSITQTSQMTELHMQFDDDADMSVFARSVPPRLSDAAQAGA